MDNDGNEVNRIYAKIALRSDSNKLFSRSVGQIHIWVTFCTTHTILNIKCINSFYHLRLLLPVKHVKVTSALIQRGSCRNEISRKDKRSTKRRESNLSPRLQWSRQLLGRQKINACNPTLSNFLSVTSINLDNMHIDIQREWHTPPNYNFTYDLI